MAFVQIRQLIRDSRPQIVVHAAAERRLEECEKDPERTMRINANSAGMLCIVC